MMNGVTDLDPLCYRGNIFLGLDARFDGEPLGCRWITFTDKVVHDDVINITGKLHRRKMSAQVAAGAKRNRRIR